MSNKWHRVLRKECPAHLVTRGSLDLTYRDGRLELAAPSPFIHWPDVYSARVRIVNPNPEEALPDPDALKALEGILVAPPPPHRPGWIYHGFCTPIVSGDVGPEAKVNILLANGNITQNVTAANVDWHTSEVVAWQPYAGKVPVFKHDPSNGRPAIVRDQKVGVRLSTGAIVLGYYDAFNWSNTVEPIVEYWLLDTPDADAPAVAVPPPQVNAKDRTEEHVAAIELIRTLIAERDNEGLSTTSLLTVHNGDLASARDMVEAYDAEIVDILSDGTAMTRAEQKAFKQWRKERTNV